MGERRGGHRPDQSLAPVLPKHLQQVLPQAQVVHGDVVVVFVGGASFENEVDVVGQQDRGEEQGGEMHAPEEDVDLEPGGIEACDEHNHGENELEDLAPRGVTELRHQEGSVEVGAVDDGDPHVEQEQEEEAVVPVADAVPHKHAVVLPLQNANVANVAVPRPRRGDALA